MSDVKRFPRAQGLRNKLTCKPEKAFKRRRDERFREAENKKCLKEIVMCALYGGSVRIMSKKFKVVKL